MASSNDYLIYVLELLREIRGITYKKMMGEYLLYKDGIIFGGIFDNRFLIKKCHKYEGVLEEQIPYPNAKPMLLVDSEDPDVIKEMVLEVLKEIKSSEEKDKKATLLKEISIKKKIISESLENQNDKEIVDALYFLKDNNQLNNVILSKALTNAIKEKKKKSLIDIIYILLIEINDGEQNTESANYFPIKLLMEEKMYDKALELLHYSEDENCILNTDAWVYLNEGICLYKLKKYEEARYKLHLAMDDEDYAYEAHQLENKIKRTIARKRKDG